VSSLSQSVVDDSVSSKLKPTLEPDFLSQKQSLIAGEVKKSISQIKDADLALVEIKEGTPHCKIHGAMNKLTKDGIWRCVSTYKRIEKDGKVVVQDNACKAGCLY